MADRLRLDIHIGKHISGLVAKNNLTTKEKRKPERPKKLDTGLSLGIIIFGFWIIGGKRYPEGIPRNVPTTLRLHAIIFSTHVQPRAVYL